MAASSPVPSSNSNDTTTTITAAVGSIGTIPTAATSQRSDTPKQNLRGLNKPKCSKCGNVARSRCPYQSCKSCCAKAQNPCHIHVLKANATFPDKTASSSSPMFNQQSTEVSSTSSGLGFRASVRASSLRQLSNNFAQFNGAQVSLRSRRPLTRKMHILSLITFFFWWDAIYSRKASELDIFTWILFQDAAAINQWRFSMLKEYKEQNVAAENEAFDRYMHNVGLLEEVFFLSSSLEDPTADMLLALEPTSTCGQDNTQRMISGLRMRLDSNQWKKDAFREKIRELVDGGLKELLKSECSHEEGQAHVDDLDEQECRPKRAKDCKIERASEINNLIDKLSKARNEEDLKSCLVIKSKLFNQVEKANPTRSKQVEIYKEKDDKEIIPPKQVSDYSQPRLYKKMEINQETLCGVDICFSSLNQI